MGFDKATMEVDGIPCAVRLGTLLRHVVADALEVGPGVSGLPSVRDDPPGQGPLVALCCGIETLREAGIERPTLVVACDLPLLSEATLRTLEVWPGSGSVVPIVEGHPQPLCARWSTTDLRAALDLAEAGTRSMRALLERSDVELVDDARWPGVLDRRALADVDTPDDLENLGLVCRGNTWRSTPVSPQGTQSRASVP